MVMTENPGEMINDSVSILICAYNTSKYIEDCLRSCFAQTYKNIKIILYNDGSTDNTDFVINRFIEKLNDVDKSKIKYIKGFKNIGTSNSRNILLENINTEYACWLDSDDVMSKDRVEFCLRYLQENNDIDIVYSNMAIIRGSRKLISKKINVSVYSTFSTLKHNTNCATGFFKKHLKSYKFLSDIKHGGEDVLWIWDILRSGCKFGYIDLDLYEYRKHDESTSVTKKLPANTVAKNEEQKIIAEYLKKTGAR